MDAKTKSSLISRRAASLAFAKSVLADASKITAKAGLTFENASQVLWSEWLNDMMATGNSAEFRKAARDPGLHFLEWLKVRVKHRFHVSWRAIDHLARLYSPEIATHFASVIWPQEIAWAQRSRLSENPHVATRAALFLRETEGNPSKTFKDLARYFSDKVRSVNELENPCGDMSADDIRYATDLPEYVPLFRIYANEAYKPLLDQLSREQLMKLAERAQVDELSDRSANAARKLAATARKSPLRHAISVISAAIDLKIGPNQLFLLEMSFLDKLEMGAVPIQGHENTAQSVFVMEITDIEKRKSLMAAAIAPEVNEDDALWCVASLDKSWFAQLPSAFRTYPKLQQHLNDWKSAIVSDSRKLPYDLVGDFGYYLVSVR